jgi:hypothetical protein
MHDYKNSVVRDKPNWLEIIIISFCFIGSVLAASVLYYLMAV